MAVQLACPLVDTGGDNLVGHGSDAGQLSCVYDGSGGRGDCIYNADGELLTEESGDALCPNHMLSVSSVGNQSQSSSATSGTPISSSRSLSTSPISTTSKGGASQGPGSTFSTSPPGPPTSIPSQSGSTSTSGVATDSSPRPSVSSPPIPSDSPSPQSPVSSTTPGAAANPPHRNEARTAAIAGAVTAVCVLIAIAVLIFWIRRRRKLRKQIPEQFVESQERVWQVNSRPKAGIARPANSVHRADRVEVELGTSERDEPITARMRRVEAQLQAILSTGLPGGSPPSYTA